VKQYLWHRSHKGQINVTDLQEAVNRTERLHQAILDLPENGIREEMPMEDDGRDHSGPATPTPEEAFAELARLSRRSQRGGGNNDDDGDDAQGGTAGGAGGESDKHADSSKDRGAAAGSARLHHEAINVRTNRFRGDEFKISDDSKHHLALEHGDPEWYCRGGQIWRVINGQPPEPIMEA
jgi:hypothetical protein